MSLLDQQIAVGNEALLAQCGDTIAYWPAGVEEDAISITAIVTIWDGRTDREGRDSDEVWRAEAQIWANDTDGVATPDMKNDKVVYGGNTWTVTQVLETMGGMHRLQIERSRRDVVGRGRGR